VSERKYIQPLILVAGWAIWNCRNEANFQGLSIPTKHSLYASKLISYFDWTGVNDLEQLHRSGTNVIERIGCHYANW
jgi:hypothetical protein